MCFVVIVDDEPAIGEEFLEAFSILGCTAKYFERSSEGLTFLQETELHVHLVLIDLMMPELSGTAFLLSAERYLPEDTKIVFVTGAYDPNLDDVKHLGRFPILRKPVSITDLKKVRASVNI